MVQLFIGSMAVFRMNNYFGNNLSPQSDAEMICNMLASLMIIITLHTAAMLWRSSRKKQS